MVILFLAGHGFLDPQAQYHFATTEMDTKLPGDQGLAFPEIEALLDGLASRHKLVLMDTCHAGEVEPPDNLAAGGGNTPAGRVVARATEAMRALPEEGGSQFRSGKNLGLVQHLFSDLRAGSGAAVIGSASGNEFAFESPAWRNGVFTFAMLQALKNPGTDRDQDGRITVTELRDYVTEAVLRLTQGRQTPTTRKELMDLDDTLRVLPKQGAKRQSRKAEPK
jgi:hypothetical protein